MPKRKYLPDERRVRKLVREGWAPGDAVRHVMDNPPRADGKRTAQYLARSAKREIARNAGDARRRNAEPRGYEGTSLPAYGFSVAAGELLGFKAVRDGDVAGCLTCGADLVAGHRCATDDEIVGALTDAARRANPMGRDLQGEMRTRTARKRLKRRK